MSDESTWLVGLWRRARGGDPEAMLALVQLYVDGSNIDSLPRAEQQREAGDLCRRLADMSNMHPHKREACGEWCPGSSRSTLDATEFLAHELAQRGQP